MAAQPVTMIKDMIKSLDNADYNPHYIAHAMLYTVTADAIWESLDIYELASHKKTEYLKALLIKILPKYEAIEKFLKYPATIGDWNQRVAGLKTRNLGTYRKLFYGKAATFYDYMKDEDWMCWKYLYSDDLFKD